MNDGYYHEAAKFKKNLERLVESSQRKRYSRMSLNEQLKAIDNIQDCIRSIEALQKEIENELISRLSAGEEIELPRLNLKLKLNEDGTLKREKLC